MGDVSKYFSTKKPHDIFHVTCRDIKESHVTTIKILNTFASHLNELALYECPYSLVPSVNRVCGNVMDKYIGQGATFCRQMVHPEVKSLRISTIITHQLCTHHSCQIFTAV